MFRLIAGIGSKNVYHMGWTYDDFNLLFATAAKRKKEKDAEGQYFSKNHEQFENALKIVLTSEEVWAAPCRALRECKARMIAHGPKVLQLEESMRLDAKGSYAEALSKFPLLTEKLLPGNTDNLRDLLRTQWLHYVKIHIAVETPLAGHRAEGENLIKQAAILKVGVKQNSEEDAEASDPEKGADEEEPTGEDATCIEQLKALKDHMGSMEQTGKLADLEQLLAPAGESIKTFYTLKQEPTDFLGRLTECKGMPLSAAARATLTNVLPDLVTFIVTKQVVMIEMEDLEAALVGDEEAEQTEKQKKKKQGHCFVLEPKSLTHEFLKAMVGIIDFSINLPDVTTHKEHFKLFVKFYNMLHDLRMTAFHLEALGDGVEARCKKEKSDNFIDTLLQGLKKVSAECKGRKASIWEQFKAHAKQTECGLGLDDALANLKNFIEPYRTEKKSSTLRKLSDKSEKYVQIAGGTMNGTPWHATLSPASSVKQIVEVANPSLMSVVGKNIKDGNTDLEKDPNHINIKFKTIHNTFMRLTLVPPTLIENHFEYTIRNVLFQRVLDSKLIRI